MATYNVGDKVRIISQRGENWNRLGEMDKYCGTVMTIRKNNFGGFDDLYLMEEDKHENFGSGWCWSDNDIVALVNEVKDEKPEYKVGDRVIIEESNVECLQKFAGVEGVIERIDPNPKSTHPYWIVSDVNEYGVYCKVKCLAPEKKTEETPKFKVGDRVRIKGDADDFTTSIDGKIGEVVKVFDKDIEVRIDGSSLTWFIYHYNAELVPEEKPEEKIVITHDGKTTTATKYVNDEVVEKATARCAPEDTFDFKVGAELALERLMEKVNPPKKPEKSKYYTGKIVCVGDFPPFIPIPCFTIGKIYDVVDGEITADDGWISDGYIDLDDICCSLGHKFIPLVS